MSSREPTTISGGQRVNGGDKGSEWEGAARTLIPKGLSRGSSQQSLTPGLSVRFCFGGPSSC